MKKIILLFLIFTFPLISSAEDYVEIGDSAHQFFPVNDNRYLKLDCSNDPLTAQLDGVGVVVGVEQEPGSGGKESAENTAKNLAGFRVIIDRPTGDKVIRADPFSTQVNSGSVRMVKAEWNREYLEELQHFPFSKHKDQVDSSSGAFTILTRYNIRAGGLGR